jgi:cytochrome b subunit of formate dehydrogenase
MTNLVPYFIAWAVLAVIVIALALMRRTLAMQEDDSLHLTAGEAVLVNKQVSLAKKLDAIDKWGKILTVLLAVSGIALGSVWAMQLWEETSKAGLK